ncbi:DHHW family protein [Lachnoclostridium phytofermentans]|uniref:AlgX/AlgJ SGNH hydrolase-like domain-containing protein n=1 Tax=Lachnoclostridium phytofermentans (strain ATCC 700394 / DSM 18823 / ISDg) TaxID=357809 RepID=A9KRY8_LACP7|nr:DHHW family protein [Lachnoclostridium phytofermentans]ABX40619.1 conserved hypothetical protein [Lachnoclostridium phytofermentans ISDg]
MSEVNKNLEAIPNPPTVKKGKGKGQRAKYSNVIIFLVLIYVLTIASMVKPVKGYSESENRVLEGRPKFSLESLFNGTFISKYETFVTDQFVSRDAWIGIKTRTELAMLKKDINGVYIGKDGYLIEKVDNSDLEMEQVNRNEKRLYAFINKYKEQLGDEHVFAMIAPTAFEILKDKLPPYASGFDQGAFLDRLDEALANQFIDLRETLTEHKKDYIFYRTDHHWTTLGAYYAYVEWANKIGETPMSQDEFEIKKISNDFLGTIYSKINLKLSSDDMYLYDSGKNYTVEYNMDGVKKNSLYEMSHLDTKDKYSVYLGGNNPVVKIDSDNHNGKKLLIIKDSYAHSFAPFAANHFETTYMVDLRYFNMPMSRFIEENGITDVLVLYNVNTYVKEKSLDNMVR